MHQGVVRKNGIVDNSQVITDPVALQIKAADDGLHLDNFNPGNFEWWYFDIIEPETDCILKIVAHIGTDPLRRKFFSQIALSVKTRTIKKALSQLCQLDEFNAAHDKCNVKMTEQFHCYIKDGDYYIQLDIPGFSGEFTFTSQLPGWKPLGNEITIEKRKRSAAFGWIIPVPVATVNGTYILNGHKYNLKNASGYHDHNFWKVGQTNKLFIDDVISKWYWGRFTAADHTLIFMNTHFKDNQITSLYISDGKKLIHSSNNAVKFHIEQQKMEQELNCSYPIKSVIRSIDSPETLTLVIDTKEVIDRKDLLSGVNPILSWLIKTLVSRPAYIGLEAECYLTHAGQNIRGTGIIELMLFR